MSGECWEQAVFVVQLECTLFLLLASSYSFCGCLKDVAIIIYAPVAFFSIVAELRSSCHVIHAVIIAIWLKTNFEKYLRIWLGIRVLIDKALLNSLQILFCASLLVIYSCRFCLYLAD